ncbi:MAG: hypothetical protein K6A80_09550 [Saccharofermentans sp.]|nr:hypothetical protein [Saccharofermentans sp.]
MEYTLIPVFCCFLSFFVLSFGIYSISGKLKWPKRWKALIAGLCFYCLGDSVGLKNEGIYCGIMDVLSFRSSH